VEPGRCETARELTETLGRHLVGGGDERAVVAGDGAKVKPRSKEQMVN